MHHSLPIRIDLPRIVVAPLLVTLMICMPDMAMAQASPFLTGASSLQTKGRTLLAAAARVRETCPHAKIRAFALLRTMGLIAGVEHLLDPCTGEIKWQAGDAQRIP